MHRLGFTRQPPKAGGICKVLIALNVKAFEDALTQWVGTLLSRPIDKAFRIGPPMRKASWTKRFAAGWGEPGEREWRRQQL